MKEIKIKINNQEFIIKQTFRALMLFEEISGRNSNEIKENINDLMLLFYCILKGANKLTFQYSFDEFIDLLDDNQESIEVFNEYLQELQKEVPKQSNKKKVKKI